MREGLVGLRHLVHFIALADGVALALIGFHNFRGQRVLMAMPLRASAKSTIQRNASANWRSEGISSGT